MYSATAGTYPASNAPMRNRSAMSPAKLVVAACIMLMEPQPNAMSAVHIGMGTNVQTRISCWFLLAAVSSNRATLQHTYPMEDYISDVEDGHYPGVILRGDAPALAHAGSVCVSDIAPVDVGNQVKASEPNARC